MAVQDGRLESTKGKTTASCSSTLAFETSIPYSLPKLLAAQIDDQVFITEGEKACEARAGLSGHNGSNGSWEVALSNSQYDQ